MDVRRYASRLTETTRRYNVMAWLALLLAISNAALAGTLLARDSSERIVLLPPVLERPVSFQAGRFDDAYLEQMAVYMAELIMSYHSDNIRYRIRQFLRYVSPDSHNRLADALEADARRVINSNVSAVFFPQTVRVDRSVRRVDVTGLQRRMVAGHVISDRQLTVAIVFADGDRWQVKKLMEEESDVQSDIDMPADDSGD